MGGTKRSGSKHSSDSKGADDPKKSEDRSSESEESGNAGGSKKSEDAPHVAKDHEHANSEKFVVTMPMLSGRQYPSFGPLPFIGGMVVASMTITALVVGGAKLRNRRVDVGARDTRLRFLDGL